MAVMTGKFFDGCCDNIVRYEDRIECTPYINPWEKVTKNYNLHYKWNCLLMGEPDETVNIVVHWPSFNIDEVDKEKAIYWFVQSFAEVAKDVFFTSTDEINWTRLEDVKRDGWDFYLTVKLPKEGKLYVSCNLPFTLPALDKICKDFADYRIHIAKSAAGFDIPAFRFGTGKKVIWLQANQHIIEVSGCYALIGAMNYLIKNIDKLNDFSFFIIPSVSVDKMIGDMDDATKAGDINRDWNKRTHPETKAIHEYIQGLVKDGYDMTVMVDMHNGWCRSDDSGGNYTEFNRGFIAEEESKRRLKFSKAMFESIDWEKPDTYWFGDFVVPNTFFQYAFQTYGALAATMEFSRFKLWNRKKQEYVPISQEGLIRMGEQYAEFLLNYNYDEN